MESQCSPLTSGRAMLPSASRPAVVLCVLVLSCALASAQWVVETNSFRIKEPSSAAGEHDAAIGDVSAILPEYTSSAVIKLKTSVACIAE